MLGNIEERDAEDTPAEDQRPLYGGEAQENVFGHAPPEHEAALAAMDRDLGNRLKCPIQHFGGELLHCLR